MRKPILYREDYLKEHRLFTESVGRKYGIKEGEEPKFTGRYLVVLKKGVKDFANTRSLLESKAGFKAAYSREFSDIPKEADIAKLDAILYDEFGVGLISGEDEQLQYFSKINEESILIPEKIVVAYQPYNDTTAFTWGLQATKVNTSNYTGININIAILDTGMDINHPDFTGRTIVTNSFTGDPVMDLHGHGTHCIGTSCGRTDINGRRYGIAKDANIYVGKVLSNQGRGAQSWIIAGINWAANNNCKVISMSLGSPVSVGEMYDQAYENVAQYAKSKGAVLVAAAGNDSDRINNNFAPVGSPANCPSFCAVAAVDNNLQVANFSNRAINLGQNIEISGPGVNVYSSWPMPARYNTISGTSMATPHVAGILALLWEQNPKFTPDQIIQALQNTAQNLGQIRDFGSGLAIAP